MIKDGAEYPIICDGEYHYFIEDGHKCDEPFMKCDGDV